MQIETFKDVLDWTREFHRYLASCLAHCADDNESERAAHLLEYLADHERKLVEAIDGFAGQASTSTLNTWCYQYLDKRPVVRHDGCDKPFAEMNAEEISSEILHQHGQVIDLYDYLLSRAETASTKELLAQLLALEKHEAIGMQLSSTGNGPGGKDGVS